MKRFVVRKGNTKYLVALLDVLHRRYNVKVRYEKPTFSGDIEVEIEGAEEDEFSREVQAFCSQVGWVVSTRD